ncbi:uncharacterized protein LOC129612861 isoform X2 [Condylostylus longicornis]|uniref:uncharacterized protein LOC129612861 isoform X2 n=1 Tax=Condylostylus longicornis TaxID=2530218 RepID=UPI00244E3208|nr:uncharacterized protein LOC129612861 isoform X2 [Condylostylus longicornis]
MGHYTRLLLAHFIFVIIVFKNAHCDAPLVDSASLPLEHRSVYGPPAPSPIYGAQSLLGAGGGGGGVGVGGAGGAVALPSSGHPSNEVGDDPWPLAASNDSPQIKNLQVQCEKTHMRVNIEFDRPFYGMIFSKGFYSDTHCVHLKPGTGHLSATFEIFLNSCGMTSSANHNAVAYGAPTPSGSYVENTIIIQYDPYVQEVWDQARKLRCTWYDFYEKAVTFRPFQVDMLHAVTANFLGDNLQCWMQIQVGKGPWASEVSGIVKIGQTMTMVLAIKDDENKFDMLVRNCVAHDGKRTPIQLVDQHGCVVRPKIMSKFQKIKNFGPSASVVSFAYFQAFKFPDSMNVHFQCVIQVCRYNCPEPKCGHGGPAISAEYGPPHGGNGISSEYGPPQLPGLEYERSDYNLPPAAYPDPRHPADTSGAYSENQPDVVPSPQAQTAQTSSESNNSANSNNGNPSAQPPQNGQQQQQQQQQGGPNDIHLPPPPPPGHSGYSGGRPRSVEGLDDLRGLRRKRQIYNDIDDNEIFEFVIKPRIYKRDTGTQGEQEMTDVNTSRTIQVVAPGDVNFALGSSNNNNETVVIQSASRSVDSETICMSVPSFVGGLVMLLLVLAVASLVAAFLFVRVRHFDRKGIQMAYVN